MKHKNKLPILILLLGILLLLDACKTSRQPEQITLSSKTKEERIKSLQYQSVQYNTFASTLRFSFKAGNKNKNTSADAQLKIIKDKIIQLSLRFLGFEVARISITPEQILIIDRTNKQYFSESTDLLQTIAPFDFNFYSLQALFTNQLFIAGKQTFDVDDYPAFQLVEDDFSMTLSNSDSRETHYEFMSDYTNRILKTEVYKNRETLDMVWTYQNFDLTSNNKLFPMKMHLDMTSPNDLVTMDLLFSKVDIDTDFDLETNIPNKYRQLSLEQVLKLIQSFQ
jgi:hypothetical protein